MNDTRALSPCGTWAAYCRANRYARDGKPNCGPCSECIGAAKRESTSKREKRRLERLQDPSLQEEYLQYYRDRYHADPQKDKDRKRKRLANDPTYEANRRQVRFFGITLEEKHKLLAYQGGCAVCMGTEPNHVNGWQTDHDHGTNEVRGIVCFDCNVLMGRLENLVGYGNWSDAARLMLQVITYLINGALKTRQTLEKIRGAANE